MSLTYLTVPHLPDNLAGMNAMTTQAPQTFTLNGMTYSTDAETLNVLRGIMPAAQASGDSSAVMAVMMLGELTGRIVKVSA